MSELACSCDPDLPGLILFTSDRGRDRLLQTPSSLAIYVMQED